MGNYYMRVIYQEKANECGICIITMLHNYFYPDKKLKIDFMRSEFFYDQNGMSIDSFENNLLNAGIKANAYKIPYEQFCQTNINSFFVLCLKVHNNYHYVVAKKNKSKIIIFDPAKGRIVYSLKEFEIHYSQIVISIEKNENTYCLDNSDYKSVKTNNYFAFEFDYKFFLIFIFLELVLSITTIVSSFFVKILISHIFPSKSINNLILITLFFFLIYCFNSLFSFFITKYKMKKFNFWWKNYFYKFQKILTLKNAIFFKNTTKNEILQILEWLKLDLEKQFLFFPEFILEITNYLVIIILIGFVSPFFLLVVLSCFIFVMTICFFKLTWNKKYFTKINYENYQTFINLNNLIEFCENQKNNYIQKSLISNNVYQFDKNLVLNKKNNLFNTAIENVTSFFNSFAFLIITFVVFISIFKDFIILDISTIFLVFTLLSLSNNSLHTVFNLISKINLFKKSKEIIDLFVSSNNIVNNDISLNLTNVVCEEHFYKRLIIEFRNISFSYLKTKILFNDLNLKIKSDTMLFACNGFGKTTLLQMITKNIVPDKGEILINNFPINMIDNFAFNNSVIYLSSNSLLYNFEVNDIFSNNPLLNQKIINFLYKLNINFHFLNDLSKLSKGQIQALNFIKLIKQENKIILLDEVLSNLNFDLATELIKEFKKEIWSNNYVIFVSHNLKLKKLFKYFLELKYEN